jgi:alpha-L-rhamnosidase
MKIRFYTLLCLLFFVLPPSVFAQKKQVVLSEKIFQNPPPQYGIRCWWWWLNGNVTKEAITRDLSEMKAKGFSGACIFDAGGHNQRGNGDIPAGPLWGSPAWRELYLHAINEAEKLGLVMSLSIQSGWNLGGPDVKPDEAAKQITFAETKLEGGGYKRVFLPMPKIRDEYYKDIAVLAYPYKVIAGNRSPIKDFENKSAQKEVGWSVPETRPLLFDTPSVRGEEDAQVSQVIDVTAFAKDGNLDWDAPAGDWTILRIGYTTTDSHVSTASGAWQGRVLDYLSSKHFNRYWDTHVEPLLKMIGTRAGKVLRYLQTDSFEAGGMNWTDNFESEFKQRRGYDITPYLPILAGKIMDNRDISAKFLNDFRKTIGDLVSDKHYRLFAEKAKSYGMGIQPESAGPHAGLFDGLKNYSHSEIMMSEFWSPSPHRSKHIDRFFVKQAASAAKIFNKKLVGAESFTTIGPHWNDVIWSGMKSAADHEFCAGLNLVYLHTFTSSPKEMGIPGQEYFAGTHFNPNVTWWNYSTAFIKYLTRIQYFMQEGISQADVLYYYGDHVPNIGRFKEDDPAGALLGYDYDLINEDKLLELEVKNGQLVLPHGATYKVLALPNHKVLSLAVLRKIEKLKNAGALIIGEKTETTASLVGGKAAETERLNIAHNLWESTQNAVTVGVTAKDILGSKNILPDCEFTNTSPQASFDFIHRKAQNIDYYFISNQTQTYAAASVAFRISDKQPELWNPMTGENKKLTNFKIENGRIILPLKFTPYDAYFIVFRKPISKQQNEKSDYLDLVANDTLIGSWQVNFDTKWGGKANTTFDYLYSWTDHADEGIKFYSGTAVYKKQFDVLPDVKSKAMYLDLGEIKDVGIAKVKLNGKDLGIVWCPPFRVNVKGVLKKTGNQLEIEVVNSWRNRLVGDRGKPQNARFTQTNITIKPEWEILPSGLLGPVRLLLKQE